MKIALTGGSGGIGRVIAAQAIELGHSVVSVDRAPPPASARRDGVQFVEADICNYDSLVRAFEGCDALIHMAAIPSPSRDSGQIVHNNNVVGSYNAMHAAIGQGIRRICQASSVNAIGLSFSRGPHFDY